MSFIAEKTKMAFQLRAKGKGLEVRAVSYFGETRVETFAPTNEVLTTWLAQIPGNVAYQTQQEVGAALYNCLTAGETASLVSETLHEGKQQKQPVHFEVRLDKDQLQLAQFPWETIADASGKFLVRDGIVDVTRYIAYPQSPPALQINYLNKSLLHVMSQPAAFSSPISITKSLVDKIETLPQVTFEQLMRKLLLNYTRSAFWGVQFDGQGLLYPRCLKCGANNGVGIHHCQQCGTSLAAMAFANNGAIEWVSATEVGAILYNAQVQLALLMACEMSQYQNSFTFNGLAPELVLAGMPAIIGVQYPISHAFAHNFVSTFYKTLFQQGDLLTALRTARQMAIRDAWYSPVLYLRHQPTPTLTRVQPTYHTRSVDTAVPAQVSPNVSFLVRLWIRRPQTSPAAETQLKRELNIPEPVHISSKEAQVEVKFDPVTQIQPVEQRLLRRGEVRVQLDVAGGNVEPSHMTLFIDEQQDAPPAIFTVTARRLGVLALEFSLWQDGGKIASVSHIIEVISQQIGGYSLKESSIPVPIDRDPQIIFLSESERSNAEELYKLCLTYFSLEELRELCFELNVDYESLSGEGKPARTEALIRYLHRQSRLGQFAALVRNKRPQLNWPSINIDHTEHATQKLRESNINCINCHHINRPGAKFCIKCGSMLTAPPQPVMGSLPMGTPVYAAPQSGVPIRATARPTARLVQATAKLTAQWTNQQLMIAGAALLAVILGGVWLITPIIQGTWFWHYVPTIAILAPAIFAATRRRGLAGIGQAGAAALAGSITWYRAGFGGNNAALFIGALVSAGAIEAVLYFLPQITAGMKRDDPGTWKREAVWLGLTALVGYILLTGITFNFSFAFRFVPLFFSFLLGSVGWFVGDLIYTAWETKQSHP